jgi:hypothetical protein
MLLVASTLLAPTTATATPSPDRLVSGDAKADGATLVAGEHGAAYELRGGAQLSLSPGAEYAFAPSLRLKLGRPSDPETLTRAVRLVRGRADVTIPVALREPCAVMLRGPGKLSAVAKEGRSTFVADEARTTVASRSGEMLVGLGNEWKPLRAGLARTLAPDDPGASPRPIVVAPTLRADHPLLVVRGRGTGSAEVSWNAVKGASAYDVSLSRRAGDATVLLSHVVVSTMSTTFGSLSPGAYWVTVAGVDRQGLPGASPEPQALRVVGLDVPPGADVAGDGTVLLGREQRVSLLGAEGLEATYGSSKDFLSAPNSIGLAHGSSTVARLRIPGSKEEAVVRLEPHGLRANVQIAPHAAHWPLDRVLVRVELYDESGRPVPEDVGVLPSVTVNLETVSLKWERHGRTLSAALPPSPTPGPWVVRAEVHDRRGELLGRDFLEIAPLDRRGAAVATNP